MGFLLFPHQKFRQQLSICRLNVALQKRYNVFFHRAELQICKPAEEVGGDYFDYFWVDEEKTKFGIAIVDVSGKAMKGAMTAAMTSGMIYSEIGDNHSPHEILQKINKPMCLKTERQIFTAMSLAVIDTQGKTLTFLRASIFAPKAFALFFPSICAMAFFMAISAASFSRASTFFN